MVIMTGLIRLTIRVPKAGDDRERFHRLLAVSAPRERLLVLSWR